METDLIDLTTLQETLRNCCFAAINVNYLMHFFQLFLLHRNNRSILRKNLRFFDDVAKGTKSVAIWYENVTHMLTSDSLAYFSDPYVISFTRSIKLRRASLREAIIRTTR